MELNIYWWIEAFVGIGVVIALQYGIKRVIAQRGGDSWKLSFAKVVQPPITLLIWVLAALYFVDVIGEHLGFEIAIQYLGAIRKTAVVGCTAWGFFRWKKELEAALIAHPLKKVDLATVRVIGRLASVIVGILTGLIVMQIFGVNIAPLLAFGSIGAASVGFAGKDVMANFCSGIMLHITRPFVQGDQIYLPEKKLEGHIEEIGWFKTTIRDKDKFAVYLPNNFFATNMVVNVSRLTHRHFKQLLKIPFNVSDKIGMVVERIKASVKAQPEIDPNLPLHVFLKSFGDYACEIEIEAYSTLTDLAQFNQFHQKLLLTIQADLAMLQIPLALPAMSWKPIS